MGEQEADGSGAVPVYVTANSLTGDGLTLEAAVRAAVRAARDAGADGFELRRELLPAEQGPEQLARLREFLGTFPSPPCYSTPQTLFDAKRFERASVVRSLAEARSLGCWLVKFSLGDAPEQGEGGSADLRSTLEAWRTKAPGLQVTVENGQEASDGDVERWGRFFGWAEASGCPIRMTFDIGNWDCLGVNAVDAARILGRRVAYLHCKSVERVRGGCVSRPVDAASEQHPVLDFLPEGVPRAVEFGVAEEGRATGESLQGHVSRLRSGAFVTRRVEARSGSAPEAGGSW